MIDSILSEVHNYMFSYVQPPNEKITILTRLLKIFCVLTVGMGIFKLPSSVFDGSTLVYFLSAFLYVLSWRGLSYYYCLMNQVLSLSIIFNLLQQMAYLIQNGMQDSYLSSQGFYKMGCLIFSIIFIYFDAIAYRQFKGLALEIHEYQQKIHNIQQ